MPSQSRVRIPLRESLGHAMIRFIAAAATAALLLALPAHASPDCPEHFLAGKDPVPLQDSVLRESRALCYGGFALLHSGLARTSLWVAERLTAERVSAARQVERVNSFHPEPRLPTNERAELSDYARSGYDRGHLAPSGDMPDASTQAESFSLANIIPQDADLNRGLWAGIEMAVRDLARLHGEIYVVTGPIYGGTSLRALKGRVLVPTSVYKAVYIPATRSAGAYVAPNGPGSSFRVVSINDLASLIWFDVFPTLPADIKARPARLPKPARIQGPARETARGGHWSGLTVDLLKSAIRLLP